MTFMTDTELMLLLAEHTRDSVTLHLSHLSERECFVLGIEKCTEGVARVSSDWYATCHDGWCLV